MFLYGIILIPLVEELLAVVPYALAQFYAGDAAFDGSTDRSARLMALILDQGPVRGYFPEPDKSLFICGSHTKEETTNQ